MHTCKPCSLRLIAIPDGTPDSYGPPSKKGAKGATTKSSGAGQSLEAKKLEKKEKANAGSAKKSTPPPEVSSNDADTLNERLEKQGNKVRELKSAKAGKPEIDAAVKELLDLKAKYKACTGKDWKLGGHVTSAKAIEDEAPATGSNNADQLNEQLIQNKNEPVAFDHDCREGICGSCSLYINGEAHGPDRGVTTCQLHMRMFNDGDTIFIEPFRASAFPVIKDLVVDRSAFDRIQHAGGFISVNTSGNTIDANAIPVNKHDADSAFDAATCIGCGACVASCKNSSAMLFASAKISQFSLLPQGQPEAKELPKSSQKAAKEQPDSSQRAANEQRAAAQQEAKNSKTLNHQPTIKVNPLHATK